jgi:hypothetical protein
MSSLDNKNSENIIQFSYVLNFSQNKYIIKNIWEQVLQFSWQYDPSGTWCCITG